MSDNHTVVSNPWQVLNRYTDARIGLGRAGVSLPTHHHLQFQLDHARARDAVLRPVSWPGIIASIKAFGTQVLELHSQARDRDEYLQRPDLGRTLDENSARELNAWRNRIAQPVDLCVVVGDGLSATAVENQAVPFLRQFFNDLKSEAYSCDLLACVSQCRVGLGDEVAERINAKFLVVLIGERPGLSSADSLSLYFTYLARRGCTDADRNCISNVRAKGLNFKEASARLLWLIKESEQRQLSGVKLKDDSSADTTLADQGGRNFLIPTS